MAKGPEIQYIRFYTDGSAARKLEEQPPKKRRKAAAPRPARKPVVIHVDLLAVAGICMAVVLLVLMGVGLARLEDARQTAAAMSQRVADLKAENASLSREYEEKVDLEQIRQQAGLLGMIPVDEGQKLPIRVELPPAPTVELTLWERISAFFAGLFA